MDWKSGDLIRYWKSYDQKRIKFEAFLYFFEFEYAHNLQIKFRKFMQIRKKKKWKREGEKL